MAQQQQQAGVSGPGAQPSLEAPRDNNQIQQLREQIAQNPALLQFLIQQLASQDPTLAQTLAQNPEALLRHLGIEQQVDSDGTPIPPGAQVVSVTEEERAAIQRVSIVFILDHFFLSIAVVGSPGFSSTGRSRSIFCL